MKPSDALLPRGFAFTRICSAKMLVAQTKPASLTSGQGSSDSPASTARFWTRPGTCPEAWQLVAKKGRDAR